MRVGRERVAPVAVATYAFILGLVLGGAAGLATGIVLAFAAP
jgi:hypothetical protein